ncbi:MAG: glutathione S-transferase family protein [Hyphomicrobiaceae bacterium]
MIDLYTWTTPNGWKAACTLEEVGLPYNVKAIDITSGEQKNQAYLELNPNGRIPTIIDRDNDNFTVFESGAIMWYLAEKTGKLIPADAKGRSEVLQWLMFQVGGLGPMQGQANVFYRYMPDKIPQAIDRYQNETKRLYAVLDKRLDDRDYLCEDFSIADIAHWCWARVHWWAGIDDVDQEFPNMKRWLDAIEARPGCARGVAIPKATNYTGPSDETDALIADIQNMITK